MKKINYSLSKDDKKPLYFQLYQQIRQSILQQQFLYGEKLPSKRQLGEFLQISQNTVESAYEQLQAEGYIESLPRKGFYVSFEGRWISGQKKRLKKTPHFHKKEKMKYDFNPNGVDTEHFPFSAWQKSGRHNQFLSNNGLIQENKQGDYWLREEIATYLLATRGIICSAEQIIIGAGAEHCMQQLIVLFNQLYPQTTFTYAMESCGYITIEKLLILFGKSIVKLPINSFTGQLDLQYLLHSQANIAYLTPSHLYPFGSVLSISQRQKLLEWANQQDGRYIIEDDYDSEFRYKGRPIPALQSLDQQGKVIYLGSFSKLLFPSLRIGFMVLPKHLLNHYQGYCGFMNCAVSRFEQLRLAHFMQRGEFERHINRMRKRYRYKMELLCHVFDEHVQDFCYYGEHSGLYLLVEPVCRQKSLKEIEYALLQQNIKVYPVGYQNKLLFPLGFANLSEKDLLQATCKFIQIVK